MKLNGIERALMNNPVRASLQRFYETPLLLHLGGAVTNERILEIGCGRGEGTRILLDRCGARSVSAYDLDPALVAIAKRRLSGYAPGRWSVGVADAANLPEQAGSFGVVFDFGIVHHVSEWRTAVAEVARVLRPGGRFFFEEVTKRALQRWPYRTFLKHPEHDRFSPVDFIEELERNGLHVVRFKTRFFGDFLFGAAVKTEGVHTPATPPSHSDFTGRPTFDPSTVQTRNHTTGRRNEHERG